MNEFMKDEPLMRYNAIFNCRFKLHSQEGEVTTFVSNNSKKTFTIDQGLIRRYQEHVPELKEVIMTRGQYGGDLTLFYFQNPYNEEIYAMEINHRYPRQINLARTYTRAYDEFYFQKDNNEMSNWFRTEDSIRHDELVREHLRGRLTELEKAITESSTYRLKLLMKEMHINVGS